MSSNPNSSKEEVEEEEEENYIDPNDLIIVNNSNNWRPTPDMIKAYATQLEFNVDTDPPELLKIAEKYLTAIIPDNWRRAFVKENLQLLYIDMDTNEIHLSTEFEDRAKAEYNQKKEELNKLKEDNKKLIEDKKELVEEKKEENKKDNNIELIEDNKDEILINDNNNINVNDNGNGNVYRNKNEESINFEDIKKKKEEYEKHLQNVEIDGNSENENSFNQQNQYQQLKLDVNNNNENVIIQKEEDDSIDSLVDNKINSIKNKNTKNKKEEGDKKKDYLSNLKFSLKKFKKSLKKKNINQKKEFQNTYNENLERQKVLAKRKIKDEIEKNKKKELRDKEKDLEDKFKNDVEEFNKEYKNKVINENKIISNDDIKLLNLKKEDLENKIRTQKFKNEQKKLSQIQKLKNEKIQSTKHLNELTKTKKSRLDLQNKNKMNDLEKKFASDFEIYKKKLELENNKNIKEYILNLDNNEKMEQLLIEYTKEIEEKLEQDKRKINKEVENNIKLELEEYKYKKYKDYQNEIKNINKNTNNLMNNYSNDLNEIRKQYKNKNIQMEQELQKKLELMIQLFENIKKKAVDDINNNASDIITTIKKLIMDEKYDKDSLRKTEFKIEEFLLNKLTEKKLEIEKFNTYLTMCQKDYNEKIIYIKYYKELSLLLSRLIIEKIPINIFINEKEKINNCNEDNIISEIMDEAKNLIYDYRSEYSKEINNQLFPFIENYTQIIMEMIKNITTNNIVDNDETENIPVETNNKSILFKINNENNFHSSINKRYDEEPINSNQNIISQNNFENNNINKKETQKINNYFSMAQISPKFIFNAKFSNASPSLKFNDLIKDDNTKIYNINTANLNNNNINNNNNNENKTSEIVPSLSEEIINNLSVNNYKKYVYICEFLKNEMSNKNENPSLSKEKNENLAKNKLKILKLISSICEETFDFISNNPSRMDIIDNKFNVLLSHIDDYNNHFIGNI